MGTFSQTLTPTANNTYDIGTQANKWRSCYFGDDGYFDGLVRAWELQTAKVNAISGENLDLSVLTANKGIGLANEIASWVEVRPQGRPESPGQIFDSNPFTIVSAYWDSAAGRKKQLELFIQMKQTGTPDGYVVFRFMRTDPPNPPEWTSDFLRVNYGEGFPRIPAGKLYLQGAYGELQFYESDSSKWIVAKRESTHGTQPNRLIFSFFNGATWKDLLHLDPINNVLIPGASLIPDANLTRNLGSGSTAWNALYVGYGYTGRLIVTDQIRDNSNTYQMAKIVPASGTSRNTPAWVFFPAIRQYSLLPTSSDYGYIGEPDRYWFNIYVRNLRYKSLSSFGCPEKLKEIPIGKALGVEVEEKTLPKKLKVRYKGPTPHSEEAYIVKDLIRERLGLNMAPSEREYLKHLLEKHNGDFDKAYEEAKNFFSEEEFNTDAREIKERLEKKMPIEDEGNLDELIERYGEQPVAEALEILKFELHDQIEIAE